MRSPRSPLRGEDDVGRVDALVQRGSPPLVDGDVGELGPVEIIVVGAARLAPQARAREQLGSCSVPVS